jgi:hypothetical protein
MKPQKCTRQSVVSGQSPSARPRLPLDFAQPPWPAGSTLCNRTPCRPGARMVLPSCRDDIAVAVTGAVISLIEWFGRNAGL